MIIVPWIRKLPQVSLFIIVGGGAAAVHFFSVIFFVELFAVPAMLANIFAFFIAFCFSFLGQRYLTFSDSNQSFYYSLKRYFFVSACSFMFNEGLFFVSIYHLHAPYFIALPIIVLLVAIGTFIVTKRWAFKLSQ
ncbi:GtrA family protein [Polynucleobacter kasalickyi]|uniref:Putative flippase GtrA (Transmembrane translocase of bactoprenol-linked glucose) n=1 Tax=Polynucleobacter kasalickyi TaxID=1938817 RepID=A0A1W2BRD9_9BURK|nr:GtrA family protein [Polynucleobacter kasalickyi]SMC75459.1 Putative flippase GtrA (transmembrane translocase of bactoprenol-linked glucose) [Polynucleobacter kasalickyi]